MAASRSANTGRRRGRVHEEDVDGGSDTTGLQSVSAARLRWIEGELAQWQNEGLITPSAAHAIRNRYTADSRAKLLAIITGLGVTFVAIGLLWLVAANLDQLHPWSRFGIVVALWLGLAAAGEAFGSQRVAGVCRTLAAAAFGAVIFQAAQSLQVPAFEPHLLGYWGLGALAYAYAGGGRGAFTVGLLASAAWFGWEAAENVRSAPQACLSAMLGAVIATSVALAHRGRLDSTRSGFAAGWRILSAAMALVGLFIAAIPLGSSDKPLTQPFVMWTAGIALVTALVGVAVASRARTPGPAAGAGPDRPAKPRSAGLLRASVEILVLVGLTALAAGLALWQPQTSGFAGYDPDAMSPEVWARTGAGVAIYLLAVVWFAVLGSRRESPGLTTIALAALVLFTTFQSFAVFAPIISGATLFLTVGAVMLVTGLAAERIRRSLHRRGRERGSRRERRGDGERRGLAKSHETNPAAGDRAVDSGESPESPAPEPPAAGEGRS